MNTKNLKKMGLMTGIAVLGLGLAGCPLPPGTGAQVEYDAGFLDGFAEDGEYWMGFWDSYDTVDRDEIYYTGDQIPFLDEVSYDAGYWDGVWYAYHDGYFVDYDYAFTIGFSEGYDLAFRSNWRSILSNDFHLELFVGGWYDGYEDGFSEGRVFGATDYELGLPFDWLDAMLDYRSGTDLFVEPTPGDRINTGSLGPVVLYEYGTNPFDLVNKSEETTAKLRKSDRPVPSIRVSGAKDGAKAEVPPISYRNLIPEVRTQLDRNPAVSSRVEGESLSLNSSWLDRVNAYNNAYKDGVAKSTTDRSAK